MATLAKVVTTRPEPNGAHYLFTLIYNFLFIFSWLRWASFHLTHSFVRLMTRMSNRILQLHTGPLHLSSYSNAKKKSIVAGENYLLRFFRGVVHSQIGCMDFIILKKILGFIGFFQIFRVVRIFSDFFTFFRIFIFFRIFFYSLRFCGFFSDFFIFSDFSEVSDFSKFCWGLRGFYF